MGVFLTIAFCENTQRECIQPPMFQLPFKPISDASTETHLKLAIIFEHFSCFLKNSGILKSFDFCLNFEKRVLLKS